jgi:hypothetical protein
MTLKRKILALTFITLFLTSSSLIYCSNFASAATQTENTWVSKGQIPQSENDVRAASVDGLIYVMGSSINFEFNPATNNWTAKTPMPTPRTGFGVAVYQNKIFTIGGSSEGITFGSNEVYDPSTDTWENKKPMPTNRSYVGAAVVDGKIHLIGKGSHDVYDIVLDSWSTKAVATFPLDYGYDSATTVADNKIYVIVWNQTQIYDSKRDYWSLGVPSPTPVIYAAVCSITGEMASKRIYVLGGTKGEGGMFAEATDLTQVYDPTNDTWVFGEPMPTARLELTAVAVNEQIYAITGRRTVAFSGPLTINEQYTPFGYSTPEARERTPTPSIPEFPSLVSLLLLNTILLATACLLVYHKKHKQDAS